MAQPRQCQTVSEEVWSCLTLEVVLCRIGARCADSGPGNPRLPVSGTAGSHEIRARHQQAAGPQRPGIPPEAAGAGNDAERALMGYFWATKCESSGLLG